MNNLFALENPLMDYTSTKTTKVCEELDCLNDQKCSCSNCLCCTICSTNCDCPAATQDPDKKVAEILGFGDWAYRWVLNLYINAERVCVCM